MIFKKEDAIEIEKFGVKMRIYPTHTAGSAASLVFQETDTGHAEEFYHDKSTFLFYIIEGSGTWVIEDREYPVNAGDTVVVTPGKKFYYRGSLKQLCITAPPWTQEAEHHVRDVDLEARGAE